MRGLVRVAAMVGAVAVAACGGHKAVEIDPKDAVVGTRWNATLATPAELAGAIQVNGTAWMASRGGVGTVAHVTISNAAPGGKHPWHVHLGQCGNDQGILGQATAYEPLEVNGDGRAESEARLDLALPTSGQYFVNVHASADNLGTILACGNLAPPLQ